VRRSYGRDLSTEIYLIQKEIDVVAQGWRPEIADKIVECLLEQKSRLLNKTDAAVGSITTAAASILACSFLLPGYHSIQLGCS
jgi:hypothetical protein